MIRLYQLTILIFLFQTNLISQSYVPEKKNNLVKIKPVNTIQAYFFNLKDVKLLPSKFAHAQSLDSAYLVSIKPDRLLYRFYKNAGLAVKDSVYGGWESSGLSGHTMGHYLSAIAMMYASTGKNEFRLRANYIIDELEKCQIARKSGYIGAIPSEDSLFLKVKQGIIKSSGFDLNGGWSPWYTVHKVIAGLVDVYLYTNNKKALVLATKMADWTENTIGHLPDSTRLKMLNCEYGGMNDVLANIYSLTGNKKYLDLSYKFYDEFVMGALAKNIDPLPGKHSNTNVPKAIGSARQYELTGNVRDQTIASGFWKNMVYHHTYVIGGNSNYEYCGDQDKLNDRLSDNTCETCNTYNMLKLSRHLFSWQPTGEIMDYYERALYNHILASQHPENGMMTYFVPLRMGTKKEFSDSFNTFTCCVGSGIENHSKYAESIYSESADGNLYINLFIPSVLNWKSKKTVISQYTSFPESDQIHFKLQSQKSSKYKIFIRKPFWAKQVLGLKINGLKISVPTTNIGYIELDRVWEKNAEIELILPMDIYTESMPDNPNRISFKYGPIVLAGNLGNEMPDPLIGTPVLLTNNKNPSDWLKANNSIKLSFSTSGIGKPFDINLQPFYSLYKQYYSVYWDFFSKEDWELRQAEYQAEKLRVLEMENKTIDMLRLGEMQPERDHNLKASERSYVSDAMGRKGREARRDHYFSFDLKIEADKPNQLQLTYIGDDKDRIFDILIDGQFLIKEEWKGGKTGHFYDIIYPIDSKMLQNKGKITVAIQANHAKTAGRIFAARTLR